MNQRKIAQQVRAEVVARDKRTCRYCGKPKLYTTQLNIDHVHPEAQGGLFVADNLVVACKQCNHRKGKKSVADYVAHRLKEVERELAALQALSNTS